MKKKLVFHFFIAKNWRDNPVYKIHFNCLSYYRSCFDEAYFALSLEDPTDVVSLFEVKEKLIKIFLGIKKIEFEIIDNNPLFGEAPTFKKEIVDHLGEDDLVFFAHTKGITHNNSEEERKENYDIVCALYYCSLELEKQEKAVTNDLYYELDIFSYGSFLTIFQQEFPKTNKYNWYYAGTFFWINSKRLLNYINNSMIKIPEMSDRYYAENFLGNLYPAFADMEKFNMALGYSYKGFIRVSFTPNTPYFIEQINFLNEKEYGTFNNFVYEMKK